VALALLLTMDDRYPAATATAADGLDGVALV